MAPLTPQDRPSHIGRPEPAGASRRRRPMRIRRRSRWLPLLLLLYAILMTAFFAGEWIQSGHAVRLILTALFELAICIGLYFALRHKERLEEERKDCE